MLSLSKTRRVSSSLPSSFRALLVTFAFLVCLAAAENASAATYVVTRTDDRNLSCNSGVDCSLREAVNAANATPDADTITFSIPSASCSGAGVCTITLADEIVIEGTGGALTINGTGAHLLTIDGGPGTNRIFSTVSATVTITGMTLTGGNGTGAFSNGAGGAILATSGTLILNGVHVTGNSGTGDATTNNVGGVFFNGGANHQVLNSTFSANTVVGTCGALQGGSLTIVNSTISGNTAGGLGGGICISGNTTLRSVTVTNNTAADAGGIWVFSGTLDLGNTIVAGNSGGTRPDIYLNDGAVTTSGFNLIGINTSVEAIFPAGNPNTNEDIVGTAAAPINPMLGALADNGGTNRVPTHGLLAGSPAIDKGFSFGLTTDERGLPRPVDDPSIPNASRGDGSDIGAFELQTITAAGISISGRVLTSGGQALANAAVLLTDASGKTRRAVSSPFGHFRFDDVPAGETYVVMVTARRYRFAARTISATDSLSGLDLTALP